MTTLIASVIRVPRLKVVMEAPTCLLELTMAISIIVSVLDNRAWASEKVLTARTCSLEINRYHHLTMRLAKQLSYRDK